MVDCDLSNYFGEIPHAELLKSFARRVSDGRMLRLIKAWLEMPVEEDDGQGRRAPHEPGAQGAERHPAGSADQPAGQQPLHAALRAGLEEAGLCPAASVRKS